MGHCDGFTGICQCHQTPIFGGTDCRKMMCEKDCNGHGRCISMEQNAREQDFEYTANWDHDKIYGCSCDRGWHGYDCARRECPRGDDPLTTGQFTEIQTINCKAHSGVFVLGFRHQWMSATIPVTATAAEVRAKLLKSLPSGGGSGWLADAAVAFTGAPGVTRACTRHGHSNITVEFTQDFGDVPLLILDGTGLNANDPGTASIRVSELRKGTKENEVCSNRGTCDYDSGTCICIDGFTHSDGHGNVGLRGDCGHEFTPTIACPGELACSAHGVCSYDDYRCTCATNWKGPACDLRSSPRGKAWFDLPYASQKAHWYAECSNMGTPDEGTGTCACRLGFAGAACERLVCPGSAQAGTCYGHGVCLTVAGLAASSAHDGGNHDWTYGSVPNDPIRWDAEKIYGCRCDRGWRGFDCSKRVCPTGDDPDTPAPLGVAPVPEVQVLHCVASTGIFQLYFDGHTTIPISHDADAAAIEAALESLDSVVKVGDSGVTVVFSEPGSGACVSTADHDNNGVAWNYVSVTFVQNHGTAVPALRIGSETPGLFDSAGAGQFAVASKGDQHASGGPVSQAGTKEDAVCSNRGHCNGATGTCQCFPGYGSSDGLGRKGMRGDCGWKRDKMTGK